MKHSLLCAMLAMSALMFTNGCKSKKLADTKTTPEKTADVTVSKPDSSAWRGTQDRIDPKIGVIKTLD